MSCSDDREGGLRMDGEKIAIIIITAVFLVGVSILAWGLRDERWRRKKPKLRS